MMTLVPSNSGERLRITSNGKVGIDNTTPHRQLVVGDGGDISCFGANFTLGEYWRTNGASPC